MRKTAILLGLSLLIALGSFAQKNKRTSAYMYNKNGEYAKAKVAIDEAVKHEKTINDAKTWMYRGEIYYNIAVSGDPEIKGLATEPEVTAYESLARAKELDVKETYAGEISLYLINLTNVFYQEAGTYFQDEDYAKSIKGFEYAFKIAEADGRFDTIAAFNIGMAGVLSDNPAIASEYLQKCVDVNFQEPRIYMFYNRSVKQLGDTARAFAVLQQGREVFPNDLTLLLEEAQLYLETNQRDKLQASLIAAVEQDPTNENLFFLLGKTYDDKGEYTVAEEYYKKAAEINPGFFEAYYNIGAIYVNKAAEVQAEANDLPLNETAKYDELTTLANTNLEKAVPYLEQSLELKPTDLPTINALKEAYARLKMNDKLQKLNEK